MRRELVLTPKFKRAFRKFVGRNARLQKRIEDTLMQMQEDVFAASLGTHKLSGALEGLRACGCGVVAKSLCCLTLVHTTRCIRRIMLPLPLAGGDHSRASRVSA